MLAFVRGLDKQMAHQKRLVVEPLVTKLLEQLAKLEHDQWIYYSKDVTNRISNASSLELLQNETADLDEDYKTTSITKSMVKVRVNGL